MKRLPIGTECKFKSGPLVHTVLHVDDQGYYLDHLDPYPMVISMVHGILCARFISHNIDGSNHIEDDFYHDFSRCQNKFLNNFK